MSLSSEELQSLRIERIDVEYAPGSFIAWEREETAYFLKVKAADPKPWKQVMAEDKAAAETEKQRLMETPEAKAHLQSVLTGALKRSLEAGVLPRYQGTRPVVLHVLVHGFSIPSAVQRALLGGSPVLAAITTLRDAKTGAELAKLDRMAGGAAGNGLLGVLADQAFSDLEDRVLEAYNAQVLEWLQAA